MSLVDLSMTYTTSSAIKAKGEAEHNETSTLMTAILKLFDAEDYILWIDPSSKHGAIVLKTHATPTTHLKAWSHALLVAQKLHTTRERVDKAGDFAPSGMLTLLRDTLTEHCGSFDSRVRRLRDAGWDVDTASLQTKPGRRVEIRKQE